MEENQLPISDFKKLKKYQLTESEEDKSVDDIAKFYFYEIESLEEKHTLLVDLQNNVAQRHPRAGHFSDRVDFDITLTDADVTAINKILQDSHVEDWEKAYTYGDEEQLELMGGEGFNWLLLIQYKDGTMFEKRGDGVSKEEVLPEGYETFVRELPAFIDGKYSALDDAASVDSN